MCFEQKQSKETIQKELKIEIQVEKTDVDKNSTKNDSKNSGDNIKIIKINALDY